MAIWMVYSYYEQLPHYITNGNLCIERNYPTMHYVVLHIDRENIANISRYWDENCKPQVLTLGESTMVYVAALFSLTYKAVALFLCTLLTNMDISMIMITPSRSRFIAMMGIPTKVYILKQRPGDWQCASNCINLYLAIGIHWWLPPQEQTERDWWSAEE